MDISVFLVGVFASCALFSLCRLIRDRKEEREHARASGKTAEVVQLPKQVGGYQLRWISAAELARLIHAEPDLILFHLIDSGSSRQGARRLLEELVTTMTELEAILPWVPVESKVAIYRTGGIGFMLARRLAEITAGRETLLLLDDDPLQSAMADQRAGAVCR